MFHNGDLGGVILMGQGTGGYLPLRICLDLLPLLPVSLTGDGVGFTTPTDEDMAARATACGAMSALSG